NVRASIGAVDQEKGHRWSFLYGNNVVRFHHLDGETWLGFPLAQATLDLGVPLPLRKSSIWLRTAGGYSPGDRDEPFANFFLGGFGNNWVDHQEVKRYREAGSFPGIEIDNAAGTNFARAMIDLNLPPHTFQRLGTPALYGSWLRFSVFSSGLVTNMDAADLRRKLANVGVQADLRIQVFARQSMTLSSGYARAFERGAATQDEWMVSLKIL